MAKGDKGATLYFNFWNHEKLWCHYLFFSDVNDSLLKVEQSLQAY